MITIYVLRDPDTLAVRYVGQTSKQLEERLRAHWKDTCVCHRTKWLKQLRNAGKVPVIEAIATVEDSDWAHAEIKWIQYYKSIGCCLVNGTDGGEGVLGLVVSAETRARLSAATSRQFESKEARAAVGRVHKGKTITPENRAAVGKATAERHARRRDEGWTMPQEQRDKLSMARTGTKSSAETKQKLSNRFKGKPKGPEHRAKLAEHCRKLAASRVRVMESSTANDSAVTS